VERIRKRFKFEAVDNRFQVQDAGVERKIRHVLLREPSSSSVEPHQHPPLCQPFIPAAYLRQPPFRLKMADRKPRQVNQGHALSQNGIGDANAVAGPGVLDARFHYVRIIRNSPASENLLVGASVMKM
jgi:hypothetical protein